MPRRTTIGRDPLGDHGSDASASPRGPFATGDNAAPRAARSPHPDGKRNDRARRAVGGRLELFGGDFGRGRAVIQMYGVDRRLGFYPPTDDFVFLDSALESIVTWQDHAEHRILATIGWALTFGAVAGAPGAMIGGGIRLLHPRLTGFEMRLRDGRSCVGRTDGLTASALRVLARSAAEAPPQLALTDESRSRPVG